jgi:hypothetical protein
VDRTDVPVGSYATRLSTGCCLFRNDRHVVEVSPLGLKGALADQVLRSLPAIIRTDIRERQAGDHDGVLVQGIPNAAAVPRGPEVDRWAILADLNPCDHRLAAGHRLIDCGRVYAFPAHGLRRSVAPSDRNERRIVNPITRGRVVVGATRLGRPI